MSIPTLDELSGKLAMQESRVSENAMELEQFATFSQNTIDISRLIMSVVVVLVFALSAMFVVDQAELEFLRNRQWPDLSSFKDLTPDQLIMLRDKFVEQDAASMQNAITPLNFLEDFLSSFVLPIVTLIIGFYFGKDVANKSD